MILKFSLDLEHVFLLQRASLAIRLCANNLRTEDFCLRFYLHSLENYEIIYSF